MQSFLALIDVRFKPIERLMPSPLSALVQQTCLDIPVDRPCRDSETLGYFGLDEWSTLVSLLLADLDNLDDEVVIDLALSTSDSPEDICQHPL